MYHSGRNTDDVVRRHVSDLIADLKYGPAAEKDDDLVVKMPMQAGAAAWTKDSDVGAGPLALVDSGHGQQFFVDPEKGCFGAAVAATINNW